MENKSILITCLETGCNAFCMSNIYPQQSRHTVVEEYSSCKHWLELYEDDRSFVNMTE